MEDGIFESQYTKTIRDLPEKREIPDIDFSQY